MMKALLILLLTVALPAQAAVIYSGLKHVSIPTNLDGVYIDIDGNIPITSLSDFSGADVNPFFGGLGIANNPAFQPARTGTGILDAIIRLNAGDVIDASRNYASGYGGSGDPNEHIGTAANMFQSGTEAFFGYRFTPNTNIGTYYGWMRVKLTTNLTGGEVIDWAYDDSGAAILAGAGLVPEPSRPLTLTLAALCLTLRRRRPQVPQ
jgi:hypothetical protein